MKLKLCTALLTVATILAPFSVMAEKAQDPAEAKRAAVASYGKLPLSFEPTASASRFLARSGNYAVSVGAQESSVAVGMAKSGKHQALHFSFENANPDAPLSALEPLPGVTNYYLGQDRSKWRLGVKSYAKLRAQSVYPGVDVIYYGDHRRLEFDFVVAPKADPAAIALSFTGMDKLYKDDSGDLVAEVGGQPVRFAKPYAYQKVAGGSKAVAADYELAAGGKVRLHLGDYDRNAELIIDPVVGYATYLGGTLGDLGNAIAVDSTGAVYVTGQTCSSNFPDTNPGGLRSFEGACDAFVTKYAPGGTGYVYNAILGGSMPTGTSASGNGIALDSSNNVYIVGTTNISDLPGTPAYTWPPVTPNSYQGGDDDAFIVILAAGGNAVGSFGAIPGELVRSTYLGGSGPDAGYSIGVDQASPANVTVVGQTCSPPFSTLPSSIEFPGYNGFETKVEDCVAFVTKLDNALDIGSKVNGTIMPGASALSPLHSSGGKTYYFSEFFGGQPVAPYPTAGTWTEYTNYPLGAFVLDTQTPPHIEEAVMIGDGTSGLLVGESGPYVQAATTTSIPTPAWNASLLGTTPDSACPVTIPPSLCPTQITWEDYGPPVAPVVADTVAYGVVVDPTGDALFTGGTDTASLASILWPCHGGGNTGAWIVKVSGNTGGCIYQRSFEATPTDPTGTIDTGRAIAVDSENRAYVAGTVSGTLGTGKPYQGASKGGGSDAFLVRVNALGSAIDYATYLGGSGADQGLGVAVDASFSAYVTGSTMSVDFPVINPLTNPNNSNQLQLAGTQGTFVSKFTSDGSALIFSSYMGGSASDQGNAIAVIPDTTDPTYVDMFVAGSTTSQDLLSNLLPLSKVPIQCGSFPTFEPSPYAPPQPCNQGNSDAFLAMIPGNGIPTVIVTPGSLNFAAQDVGTTSATAQPVTYFNTNLLSTVQINSISFVTSYPGSTACTQFQQASGSGTPPDCGNQSQITPAGTLLNGVPSTGTCQIEVIFTPSAQNLQNCYLVVSDSASSTPHVVNLRGTGAVPVDKFSASNIPFGSQAVGLPVTQTVTLTNTSINGTLNVSDIEPGGNNQADFSESDNCRPSVAPTAYCTITVVFTPGAVGLRTGSVTVTDNAQGSPHVINLSGTGTGTGGSSSSGSLQVSTTSLAFVNQPAGTPSRQTMVLSNTGSTTIPVTFNVTGTNKSDFVESDNCGGSVAGAAECNVTVTFTPTAAVEAATLTITGGTSTTLTVTLTGTGTSGSTTSSGSAPFTMPTSEGVSTTEGSTATYSFPVAPVNGSKASVSFTCSGPVGSSCSLSPSSFTMDGVTVTTVTLTVNTTGGTGAMSKLRIGTRSMFLAMLPFSMMGMLLINKRRGNLLVLLLVALCLAMGALGCGGGSSSSSSGALAPGGPYPVTVTATSSGATQTLTVGLTVNKQ